MDPFSFFLGLEAVARLSVSVLSGDGCVWNNFYVFKQLFG